MNYTTTEKKEVCITRTEKVTRESVAQIPFDNMVLSTKRYLALNLIAFRRGLSVNELAKTKVSSSQYLADNKIVLRQGKEVVALLTDNEDK